MYLIFETAKIALIANESAIHESMAYELNGGSYSSRKVEKSHIPRGYEVFDRNLYHLEVLYQQR